MKDYKVEVRTYYSKITTNKEHIAESSQKQTQEIINEYASDGWTLASTNATSFGLAMYVYLFFERDRK